MNADLVTETDAQQIPTGKIAAVTGTAFDFRTPRAIGAMVDSSEPQMAIARGYDHNFVLNKSAPGALEWAARLEDPQSGIRLEVLTTEPGMQFYAGNFLDGKLVGKAGKPYGKRSGFCLETQHYPDTPNHANFPTTLVKPGSHRERQRSISEGPSSSTCAIKNS